MRRTSVHICCLALAAASSGLAAASATAAETAATTWVVDRDGVQCAKADFTSIQAAVQAASAGDLIRVCPDVYRETVTVDKPLTLKGQPDAVEAVDCFDPTPSQPGDADATQQAIVDGTGSPAQELFNLQADDIVLAGFVLQGASNDPLPSEDRFYRRAINTSDQYSGYRIHHNLMLLNTVGIQFGSNGLHESRFHANCVRENDWGLGTDDRALIDARVDHNATFRTRVISFEPALGDVQNVTFDHNHSRQDGFSAYMIRNSSDSSIVDNQVAGAGVNAIKIVGGHEKLVVGSNRVDGVRGVGILMDADATSENSQIVDNTINDASSTSIMIQGASKLLHIAGNHIERGGGAGISVRGTLSESLITGNTTTAKAGTGITLLAAGTENAVNFNVASGNGASGIFVGASFTRLHVSDNTALENGGNGIAAALGATGHRFERNSMTGNGRVNQAIFFDANDANPWPSNVWIDNTCVTDNVGGAICGVG